MRHLSSYLVSTRKRIGIHPVEYQASVPEWKNAPSEKDTADYKTETLQTLGTVVCPLNMDISATDEPEETRKAMVDKCNCSHPGSGACVRVHVKRAGSWIKYELGEEAFRNCGLDAMGEQVLQLWTAEDKKKLEGIEKLIPQNKHEKFVKIASKQFSSKKTKDLAKYYYNVFLPRRLASLTRAKPTNAEDADTDDENSDQDDDMNEHHSEENSKTSGFSSKRSRK